MKYDTPEYDIPFAYKEKLCQNCISLPRARKNYEDVGEPCASCWGVSLKRGGNRPNFKRPPIPLEELM